MHRPPPYHRRSIRIKNYDYSLPGAYFVTLCVENRSCLFGQIANDIMCRNARGDAVAQCWEWLAKQYPYVELDYYTVMPNHLHGILVISSTITFTGEGGSRAAPTAAGALSAKRKPLGQLVGAFKTQSTKRIRRECPPYSVPPSQQTTARPPEVWQRDFYDHIIRDEEELQAIRKYMVENPLKWALDRENPESRSSRKSARPWEM